MDDTLLFDFVLSNNKLSTSHFFKLLAGKANIFNLWNLLFRFWSPIHREMAALSGKNITLIFSTTFPRFNTKNLRDRDRGRLSLNRYYYSLPGASPNDYMITKLDRRKPQSVSQRQSLNYGGKEKYKFTLIPCYTIKAMDTFIPWYESKLVAEANLKSNSILSWR